MSKVHTITVGEVIGVLTAIEQRPASSGHSRALYRCVCGKEVERNIGSLLRPKRYPASCGCKVVRRKKMIKKKTHSAFDPVVQSFYLGRADKCG
jgi:hypothetical protein